MSVVAIRDVRRWGSLSRADLSNDRAAITAQASHSRANRDPARIARRRHSVSIPGDRTRRRVGLSPRWRDFGVPANRLTETVIGTSAEV
jgi:hypothetical protein